MAAVSAVLAVGAVVAISASPGSVQAANIVPHDLGACTALGSAQPAKDSKGKYYAGAAVDLNASGLAAGPVRLFYNGPRGSANGATEQSPRQYTFLGTDAVASSGALHVHVTIPDDAAPGTGHVLAYSTAQSPSDKSGLLSRAIHDWPVPATYHNPWVTLSGEPGQTLDLSNTANGDTCHALVGADGQTAIVAKAPGLWDVAVQGKPEVPHEVLPLVYGGIQTMPALPHFSFLAGCGNVRFRAFDLFSGTPRWVSNAGGPPFGYFLSRSNTPDPIAIVATAYDGSGAIVAISEECLATINALAIRQITPNPGGGTTTKVLPNSGWFVPPHPTIQSFGVPFGTRLCSLLPCPGGNPTSAWNAVAIPSGLESRVFKTQLGLTGIPADTEGTGTLTMSDGVSTQTFGTMQLIANHWGPSSLFSGASPVFHTNTLSYDMVEPAGNIPALGTNNNYTGPNVNFGWNSVPYISNSFWSFNTQVKSYYAVKEAFSTDGLWGSTGNVFNAMTLLGQNIYGPSWSGIAMTAHNPYRPTYGFNLPNAATWTKEGLVDTTVPVGGISIGNWNIGVNLHVKVDASAALGVSGSVGQNLNTYTVTFTPSGTLHGFAALSLDAGPVGVGLAIDGWMTLAVPIHDVVPSGWSAGYCLTGELDWGIWHWWDFGWFGSGANYWYGPNPIVGPGTIAGSCPAALLRHMKVFHHRVSAATKARLRSEGFRVIEVQPSPPPPSPPMASEDFDSAHHGAAVWVEAQGGHGALMAAPWAGTHWGTPVTVATDGQALGSPHVVELGDGRAVAAWRELMPFTPAEQDLLTTYKQNHDYAGSAALVASHAEVFSAVFNGGSWSTPHRLTNDLVGDSSLALVADKSAHTATIVWGRTDPLADYGLVKATFSGSPGSWSAMTAIAHTVGTGTRQPSLAIAKGTLTLGFISGPPGHGKVKVGTLSGSKFTPAASQPPIPEGAENLRLVRLPTGTLATADVQPLSAGAFTGDEPTLYVATNLGAGWKLTNVGAGDSPQVAFDGSNTVITFRRPDGGSLSPNTPNQLADVEVSSKGVVSKVGSVTGASAQAMPAAAAFDPTGHLQLLYGSDPLQDGPAIPNPNWSWAINAAAKSLSSLEAASVPLHARVVADLAGAKVSPAACTPGKSVTATVTLHNPAPTLAKAAGAISEVTGAGGGPSSARRSSASGGVHFSATIKGNSTATLKVSFVCPSSGYTLHATGVASTSSPTLGVPGAPSNLVVGSSSAGDARLTWNLPSTSKAVRTLVYQHGSAGWVLEGITEATSFIDLGAGTDSTRQYVVVAVDKYGRQSRRSKVATAS